MIFSLFGKKDKELNDQPEPDPTVENERHVRPMQDADIQAVLAIIENHDEDDAEEAAHTFRESLDGMFVVVENKRITGVTGAVQDPETDAVCWLSWTYVAEREQGKGVGRYLVEGLLSQLQDAGIRKVFMSTGDYEEDGEDIYAAAKALYTNLGAELESRIDNYHEVGEARYVYGLDIGEDGSTEIAEQTGNLFFNGIENAPESDGGLSLTWEEFNSSTDKGQDPREQLQGLIDEARTHGGRFLMAVMPSDLSEGATQGLDALGFSPAGELKNYYRPGVSQVYRILYL